MGEAKRPRHKKENIRKEWLSQARCGHLLFMQFAVEDRGRATKWVQGANTGLPGVPKFSHPTVPLVRQHQAGKTGRGSLQTQGFRLQKYSREVPFSRE